MPLRASSFFSPKVTFQLGFLLGMRTTSKRLVLPSERSVDYNGLDEPPIGLSYDGIGVYLLDSSSHGGVCFRAWRSLGSTRPSCV